MNNTIGSWTVYDLIWFLVVWRIVVEVTPLLLRDIFGPALAQIAKVFKRV